MATVRWTCNKDSTTADNGTSLGVGNQSTLPVGNYYYGGSNYNYRSFLGFPYSFSGMVSITSATLYLKTSSQVKLAFSSDPDIYVRRANAAWSEGTATSLSATNAIERSNEPAGTGTVGADWDITTSENTWESQNITTMMQEALAAGVFYGLILRPVDTGSGVDVTEFWSSESGNGTPYIDIVYTTNVKPSAPTLTSPSDWSYNSASPALNFNHNDSDGDGLLNWDLQVSTDSTFASVTHWDLSAQTSGITSNSVSLWYAGTALSEGGVYYWRARTRSAAGVTDVSDWSSVWALRVHQSPAISVTQPGGVARVAKLTYPGGSGWDTPRMELSFSGTPYDGAVISSHQVEFYTSNTPTTAGGTTSSLVWDPGEVAGTPVTVSVPYNLTQGNFYWFRIRVKDSWGWWSGWSAWHNPRARWALTTHKMDCTTTPTSLLLAGLTTYTGSESSITMEYGSNASDAVASSWYASLGGVPLARYVSYRVWMFAWGASPSTPSLYDISITYSTTTYTADRWTPGGSGGVSDPGAFVYGTRSLKIIGSNGNWSGVSQECKVLPYTDYIFQGRMKALGNPYGYMSLIMGGVEFALAGFATGTQDFVQYVIGPFNTGANDTVRVVCSSGSPATTGAAVWFDALKLEASRVVTPWTPGFVGKGMALDQGGIQISAAGGSGTVFRLEGSGGGARDTVALGVHGLIFGGDTELGAHGGTGDLYVNGIKVPRQDELYAPNLLGAIGGFRGGTTGWTLVQNGDTTAAFDLWSTSDTSWTLRDGDVAAWNSDTGPYGSTVYINSTKTSGATGEPFIHSSKVPVVAGRRYSLSALLGPHRLVGGRLVVWWVNDAESWFDQVQSTEFTGSVSGTLGGPYISTWEYAKIDGALAPSGAVAAVIGIITKTPVASGSGSYMFIDQVNFTQSQYALPFMAPGL